MRTTTLLPLLAFVATIQAAEQPNIVIFMVDDLGWKDLGCMGSTYYRTPNIDQLAAQGMRFTDAYANAPNCAPSRACLMTGQYSPRHGIYTVGTSERGNPVFRKLVPTPTKVTLDTSFVTLPEVLRSAGYVCGHVGKWHLGVDPETGPTAQGFNMNVAGNHAGMPRSYFSPYRNRDLPDGLDGEYLTDRLTDEAIAFIETNRHRPFFVYLPHFAVHTPIQPKPELAAGYEQIPEAERQGTTAYAAMVESVDQSVGRLLASLDRLELADNTIVILFSDNGGHGNQTSMAPLRGSKGMIYEGGIRVPLIIRWPGRIAAGSICREPVIGLDLYPTLADIALAAVPADVTPDGVSLTPLLDGGSLNRDALFWHFPAYLEPYNESQLPWRITPCSAIRRGDWKLIEFFEDSRIELYNLVDDPGETRNVAGIEQQKARAMHEQLMQWRQSVNAPVPDTRNPLFDPAADAMLIQ